MANGNITRVENVNAMLMLLHTGKVEYWQAVYNQETKKIIYFVIMK